MAFTAALPICALIAARNEEPYLRVLLPLLAEQGIDVAILDHGSSDGSLALYERHRSHPVVHVEHLPYTGVFSLVAQLEAKQKLAARLPHPWLVHHDADELLHHREGFAGLRACIEDADACGANAVNFEEFVFLPAPQRSHAGDHVRENLRYYYFLKGANRLNRAFRRELLGCNTGSGGHALVGAAVKLAPVTHVLRHYIGLSEAHLQRKYATRRFAPEELAQGWHQSRLQLAPQQMRIPPHHPAIQVLPAAFRGALDRSHPVSSHYWHWR